MATLKQFPLPHVFFFSYFSHFFFFLSFLFFYFFSFPFSLPFPFLSLFPSPFISFLFPFPFLFLFFFFFFLPTIYIELINYSIFPMLYSSYLPRSILSSSQPLPTLFIVMSNSHCGEYRGFISPASCKWWLKFIAHWTSWHVLW